MKNISIKDKADRVAEPSASYKAKLLGNATILEQTLYLQLGGEVLQVRSNSAPLLNALKRYFRHIVCPEHGEEIQTQMEVIAIDGPPLKLGLPFTEWQRETGKDSRKDSYIDLPNGRLLRKVRTGMIFLQEQGFGIASGPCMSQHNQLINFINSQYMNRLQQQGWLICHAAGISLGEEAQSARGIAMAGFSGGGKSTLMLQLMNEATAHYLSNDRLFIRHSTDGVEAAGIPKLPRINPGTILNNPALLKLVDKEERDKLRKLPTRELWDLEKKYDVPIEKIYGAGRIRPHASLDQVVLLNWHHDSKKETRLSEVDLQQRPDLLPSIMKSPGPFYQDSNGKFLPRSATPDPDRYVSILKNVTVFELSGKIDFTKAVKLILK